MIELISIENWIYLKNKLYCHYEDFIKGNYEHVEYKPEFRWFIEKVYRKVLEWNKIIGCDSASIDIIDNDDELALDLLDSLGLCDNPTFQNEDLNFFVEYVNTLGSIIIEYEPRNCEYPLTGILLKPEQDEVTNVVRQSKSRK